MRSLANVSFFLDAIYVWTMVQQVSHLFKFIFIYFFKHAFFQVVLVQFDSSRLAEPKHS